MYDWLFKDSEINIVLLRKFGTAEASDLKAYAKKSMYLPIALDGIQPFKRAEFADKDHKIRKVSLSAWAHCKTLLRKIAKSEKIDIDTGNRSQVLSQIAAYNLLSLDMIKILLNHKASEDESYGIQEKDWPDKKTHTNSYEVQIKHNAIENTLPKPIEAMLQSITTYPVSSASSRVIELNSPISYSTLGIDVYQTQKKADVIEVLLTKVIKMNPIIATVYNNFGTAPAPTPQNSAEDDATVTIIEMNASNITDKLEETHQPQTTLNPSEDWFKEVVQTNISDTATYKTGAESEPGNTQMENPDNKPANKSGTADTTEISNNSEQASTNSTGTKPEEVTQMNSEQDIIVSANTQKNTDLLQQETNLVKQDEIIVTSNSTVIDNDAAKTNQTQTEQISPKAEKTLGGNLNNPIIYNHLGSLLKAQKKPELALNAYKKSIDLDHDNIEAHNNLGAILQKKEKLDLAKKEYETVIEICQRQIASNLQNDDSKKLPELNSSLAIAHNNLGTLYQKQGRLGFAETEYQTAIKIVPDFAAPHYNLGNLWKKLQKYGSAETELKIAVGLDPHDDLIRYSLGNLYHQQGSSRYQDAEKTYKEAIKLNDKAALYHANLGKLYYEQVKKGLARAEKLDLAKKEYEIAKELSINDEIHETICTSLETLKSISLKTSKKSSGTISIIDKEEREVVDITPGTTEPENFQYIKSTTNTEEFNLAINGILEQLEHNPQSDGSI